MASQIALVSPNSNGLQLIARASSLVATASNLITMASNLVAFGVLIKSIGVLLCDIATSISSSLHSGQRVSCQPSLKLEHRFVQSNIEHPLLVQEP